MKKSILLINKYFPEENGELWLTASELRDRLVHCGVHPVLTVDIVNDILRLSNKEEIAQEELAGHTGLKCPMPKRSKRSKAELLDCDIDELSTVDQFSKKLRIMKHKVELLDW